MSTYRVYICVQYPPCPNNFVEGPPNLPLVGSTPFLLGYNGVLTTIIDITKKYGPVAGFVSNGRPKVILADAEIIKKVFTLQEVTNRPPQGSRGQFRYGKSTGKFHPSNFQMSLFHILGPVRGVLFSSGQEWKEQRSFVVKSLGDLGLGKSRIETKIWKEANKLKNLLEEQNTDAIDLNLMMNISIINTLWSITVSETLDIKDENVRRTVSTIDKAIKGAGHMHPLTLIFPFLAKLFPTFFGIDQMAIAASSLKSLIDTHIKSHREAFNEEKTEDFLDKYISNRKKNFDLMESSFFGHTGCQNQQIVLFDLFIAGVETTTTSLLWAILYLLHHPEVQEKMFSELSEVEFDEDEGIKTIGEKVCFRTD